MYASAFLVASGTLFSLVAAVPLVNRDIVWHTEVIEDVVTIPVTMTVWVSAGEYSATASSTRTHFGHHGHATSSSSMSTALASSPPAASSTALATPPPAASSTALATPPPAVSSTFVVVPSPSLVVSAPPPPSSLPVQSMSTVPVVSSPAAQAQTPASSVDTASTGASGLAGGLAAAGKSYTGEVTYYQTGMGACGWTNTASERIVAVSHIIFDSYASAAAGNSNNNPVCGKYVTITGKDGSQYQAKVVDRCVGCAESDLDLSEDFFKTVTNNGDGRVSGVNWAFA